MWTVQINVQQTYTGESSYCLLLIPHQEQASRVQVQLEEEELKNRKLLQQIAKLEEQITVISQESDRKDEVQFINFIGGETQKYYYLIVLIYLFCFSNCFNWIQLLSTERNNRKKDQLTLQETINNLQQSLQSEQQAAEG